MHSLTALQTMIELFAYFGAFALCIAAAAWLASKVAPLDPGNTEAARQDLVYRATQIKRAQLAARRANNTRGQGVTPWHEEITRDLRADDTVRTPCAFDVTVTQSVVVS
jgi:hypothetical protein